MILCLRFGTNSSHMVHLGTLLAPPGEFEGCFVGDGGGGELHFQRE